MKYNSQGDLIVFSAGSADTPFGKTALTTAVLGANGSLAYLSNSDNGTNKGPDVFPVDLSLFGSSDIYIVVICETGTVTTTVTVQYSNDLTGSYLHPTTPDPLLAEAAGNREVLLPKKDLFAHISVEQNTGSPEKMWVYVVGRELA